MVVAFRTVVLRLRPHKVFAQTITIMIIGGILVIIPGLPGILLLGSPLLKLETLYHGIGNSESEITGLVPHAA